MKHLSMTGLAIAAAVTLRGGYPIIVEIERLEALKRINPSVRDEEIAYFRQLETRVETMLGGAHMRLDALRVLVTV